MITVSMPQTLKVSKAVIKTSLKSKDDTKKSNFNSTSSDSPSEIIIKCTHQNQAPAKSDFAEWLRVPNCKLYKLMLWNLEKNAKGQGPQEKLFKRNISFMIKIFKENIKSKTELLVKLTKIKKHYSSAYVMCQTLISATNTEISFVNWDTLFKLIINKHRNKI